MSKGNFLQRSNLSEFVAPSHSVSLYKMLLRREVIKRSWLRKEGSRFQSGDCLALG